MSSPVSNPPLPAHGEELYRLLVESVKDYSIFMLDCQGHVTSWNEGARRIKGYTAEEIIGQHFSRFFPPEAIAKGLPDRALARAAAEGKIEDEGWRVRKDGSRFWANVVVTALRDASGQLRGFSKITRDLTERKLDEENRRQLHDELEKRVQERTEALHAEIAERKLAEEMLKDTDRRKDEFLAMLAHELRNPLAPIRNTVLFLAMKGPKDPELDRAREVIDRQVKHLTRLVDDLLDISRIGQGKVRLRKDVVDLAAVVRQAVETSRALIEGRRHTLTVSMAPEPMQVNADPTRLAQVISNLLNNAAKYTDAGGHIWLTIDRDGEEAIVRVEDTGVGISAEMLPKVFDLFTQVNHSLDRAQGGLGIGLTLVRTLVEMHGGTVQVASDGPGEGSEFTVRLPILIEQPTSSAGEGEGEASSTSSCCRRVLVVDDERDSANTLSLLLKIMGHEVRTAYDGPAALREAEAWEPEIVLLDIGLPGMSGHEVAQRLRTERHDGLTLVALTGYGQDEDRRRSQEAGFDLHFVKPLDPNALRDLLAFPGPINQGVVPG